MAAPSGNANRLTKAHPDAVIAHALKLMEYPLQHHDVALTSPQAVKDYLRLKIAEREHELFSWMYLDSQHRLIACEELFRGTLAQTSVYPREVVKAALRHNGGGDLFSVTIRIFAG